MKLATFGTTYLATIIVVIAFGTLNNAVTVVAANADAAAATAPAAPAYNSVTSYFSSFSFDALDNRFLRASVDADDLDATSSSSSSNSIFGGSLFDNHHRFFQQSNNVENNNHNNNLFTASLDRLNMLANGLDDDANFDDDAYNAYEDSLWINDENVYIRVTDNFVELGRSSADSMGSDGSVGHAFQLKEGVREFMFDEALNIAVIDESGNAGSLAFYQDHRVVIGAITGNAEDLILWNPTYHYTTNLPSYLGMTTSDSESDDEEEVEGTFVIMGSTAQCQHFMLAFDADGDAVMSDNCDFAFAYVEPLEQLLEPVEPLEPFLPVRLGTDNAFLLFMENSILFGSSPEESENENNSSGGGYGFTWNSTLIEQILMSTTANNNNADTSSTTFSFTINVVNTNETDAGIEITTSTGSTMLFTLEDTVIYESSDPAANGEVLTITNPIYSYYYLTDAFIISGTVDNTCGTQFYLSFNTQGALSGSTDCGFYPGVVSSNGGSGSIASVGNVGNGIVGRDRIGSGIIDSIGTSDTSSSDKDEDEDVGSSSSSSASASADSSSSSFGSGIIGITGSLDDNNNNNNNNNDAAATSVDNGDIVVNDGCGLGQCWDNTNCEWVSSCNVTVCVEYNELCGDNDADKDTTENADGDSEDKDADADADADTESEDKDVEDDGKELDEVSAEEDDSDSDGACTSIPDLLLCDDAPSTDFSIFCNLWTDIMADSSVKNGDAMTVFVPTDEAFTHFYELFDEADVTIDEETLDDIFLFHVTPTKILSTNFECGGLLNMLGKGGSSRTRCETTTNGKRDYFTVQGGGNRKNNIVPRIESPNLEATCGKGSIVHVISEVLLPNFIDEL